MAEVAGVAFGALSLLGAITKLSIALPQLISGFRQASEDIQVVRGELEALNVPLIRLQSISSEGRIPEDLRSELESVLGHCKGEIERIHLLLQKSASGQLRSIRWTVNGRAEIYRLKSTLEAHKSALELTLTLCDLLVSLVKLLALPKR